MVRSPAPKPEDIVVVVGNPRPGSRTHSLAAAVTTDVRRELADRGVSLAGVLTVDLAKTVSVSFGADSLGFDNAAGPRPEVDPFLAVARARLLVVATPSYKGSYTGLLKIFFDQLPHRALTGVTALPVVTAASEDHLRATSAHLVALLTELGAAVPAPAVAIGEKELDQPHEVAAKWAVTSADPLATALAPARVASGQEGRRT